MSRSNQLNAFMLLLLLLLLFLRFFVDEQSLVEHRATKHRRRSSVESFSDRKLQRAQPTCDELMLQIPVSTLLSSSVPSGCCGSFDPEVGGYYTAASDCSDIVDDSVAWLRQYVQQEVEFQRQQWTTFAAHCQQLEEQTQPLYRGEDEFQTI